MPGREIHAFGLARLRRVARLPAQNLVVVPELGRLEHLGGFLLGIFLLRIPLNGESESQEHGKNQCCGNRVPLGDAAQRDLDVPALEQRAPVEIEGEARGDVERLEEEDHTGIDESVGHRGALERLEDPAEESIVGAARALELRREDEVSERARRPEERRLEVDPHHGEPHRVAHRQVERAREVKTVQGQRAHDAAGPLAERAQHRARRRYLAEHRAREHVQHRAVVQRLEPPDGEDRDPDRIERPAQGDEDQSQRNEDESMGGVNGPPPALQHR